MGQARVNAADQPRSKDSTSRRNSTLIVIQPTPFCNIDCRYCYLPQRTDTTRLAFSVISNLFRKLFASHLIGTSLVVVWHAGEPLVMGVDFYERAFELIA